MRQRLILGSGIGLLLLATSIAEAQQTSNPIAPLVGNWDLPGTLTRLKIHADGTVDHSTLGEGTIRFDETELLSLGFSATSFDLPIRRSKIFGE